MRHREPSILLPMLAALAIHAALAWHIHQAAAELRVRLAQLDGMALWLAGAPADLTLAEPEANAAELLPDPQPFVPPPVTLLQSDFGDRAGGGGAPVATAGEEPAQTPLRGREQPFLSLDPEGMVWRPVEASPVIGLGGMPASPAGAGGRPGEVGAPSPPLPPAPRLAARAPVRQAIAEAPPRPDEHIGPTEPLPAAEPSVVAGAAEQPNQVLVEVEAVVPTTLPAVVVTEQPRSTEPDEVVANSADNTAAEPDRRLAVLDSLKEPTTQQAQPDDLPPQPDWRPEDTGTAVAAGPTTRPADALADSTATRHGTATETPSREQPGAGDTPLPPVSAAAVALAGSPGRPALAGDPAPASEMELDPFSPRPSVVFRNGRVEARLGREVRPIRPQVNMRGEVDAFSLPQARVGVRVSIDATGKVTDVRILSPSGSRDIDLATEVALYKWRFEPPVDQNGRRQPDVIVFDLVFR